MARLYLSLTDGDAVARRDALSARLHAMPSATWEDNAAMRTVAADWAAIKTTVQARCIACDRDHDAIWTIRRVLADTFGHFPVYRINGALAVVDGSLPHTVERLPRDAVAVSPEDAARLWHEDNETHTFGGANVAAMLRDAVHSAEPMV